MTMNWTYKKDKNGGKWFLILGCPLKEKHSIIDEGQNVSGPSFADCAHCEFQIGKNYEILSSDGSYWRKYFS